MTSTLQRRPSLATASLLLAVSAVTAVSANAQDRAGSKDHPLIQRFKGAKIIEYQAVDFDRTEIPIKPFSSPLASAPSGSLLQVEGKVTRILYELPAGKSGLEVIRNYQQALAPTYTTVFSCGGRDCGSDLSGAVDQVSVRNNWPMHFNTALSQYHVARRSTPDGDVYVQLYAMQHSPTSPALLFQQVVEVRPMQTGQVAVLDAAALKSGIAAAGKIAVYGVYFDTGRADVKPESKPTLDEMAKLLAADAAMKVYIVGHTDNTGTLAANLDLSQRRAEAVVRALVGTYKVDAQRLAAKGVASLSPLSPNTTDAGRAKNRRVELVLQ